MISRREILRLGVAAASGALLKPLGGLAATRQTGGFTFVVLNDLHYRDDRCGPWFERVVQSIRTLRPQPAFVMLAGDLSESGAPGQLGAVREIFRPLPMPVHSVVGNHDCDEAGDFSAYKKLYGSRLDYRFDLDDCQFLAFDSTQGPDVYRTRISTDTLAWLDRTLPSVSRTKPLVILTHFPLGRNWLRPVNAHLVIELLAGHNFQAALGGHWHGLTEHDEHGIHLSTNRCASWWRENHDGSPLKGYALCSVRSGAVTHEFRAVT